MQVDALVAALKLKQVDDGRFEAGSVQGHSIVYGGQLLAQSIVAAAAGSSKRVKTLHTVFARPGRPDQPLDIAVEKIHSGRAFASSTVTISQDGKPCTTSVVLLSADEPDFIRHADSPTMPLLPAQVDDGEWQADFGGVDIDDPALTGPAELDVWTRFPGAPDDPVTAQALLAFASDFYLIGTAMRPHQGVGQARAHMSITTAVISHTLTFHEPFAVEDWLLLRHVSPHAGHGRSYGRGDVFTAAGELVASFVQDNLIREIHQQ